jgi:hypothetical protein
MLTPDDPCQAFFRLNYFLDPRALPLRSTKGARSETLGRWTEAELNRINAEEPASANYDDLTIVVMHDTSIRVTLGEPGPEAPLPAQPARPESPPPIVLPEEKPEDLDERTLKPEDLDEGTLKPEDLGERTLKPEEFPDKLQIIRQLSLPAERITLPDEAFHPSPPKDEPTVSPEPIEARSGSRPEPSFRPELPKEDPASRQAVDLSSERTYDPLKDAKFGPNAAAPDEPSKAKGFWNRLKHPKSS